jgi:hypothetical protein
MVLTLLQLKRNDQILEVNLMAKYGKKAGEKVEKAMHERKEGTLKSGKSGKKVTSKKQAIAIGLSEAREAGGKVPKKSSKKSSKKGSKKSSKKSAKKSSKKSSSKKR